MKKNMMKTMVAAICVAAASMGGMKAFDAANSSRANMLLMENVEALSQGSEEGDCIDSQCGFGGYSTCYYHCGRSEEHTSELQSR